MNWSPRIHLMVPVNLLEGAGPDPALTIQQAAQAFSLLSSHLRDQLVADWEWPPQRGPFQPVHLLPDTRQIIRRVRPGAWSVDQTLVAALSWFLTTY